MKCRPRRPASVGAPLLAALVLAAAAAGGCGGGDGEGSYTLRASTTMRVASPPLTRARFVDHINRACRRAWPVIAQNFAKYSSSQERRLSKDALYARSVQKSLTISLDFRIFDEIRIVGSPPGDPRQIENFIGPMQRAIELGELGRWRAHSPAQVVPHFTAYNRGARRYGLDDCLVNEAHLRRVHVRRPFKVRASTTIEPSGPRRAQFVARVDDFCRKAWPQVFATFRRYSRRKFGHLEPRARFAMTAKLVLFSTIDFHIFDNIRFLGAPKGETRQVEAIIRPLQEAVERGQRLAPVHSVAEVVDLFSDYNRQARRYGLRPCVVSRARLAPLEAAVSG